MYIDYIMLYILLGKGYSLCVFFGVGINTGANSSWPILRDDRKSCKEAIGNDSAGFPCGKLDRCNGFSFATRPLLVVVAPVSASPSAK